MASQPSTDFSLLSSDDDDNERDEHARFSRLSRKFRMRLQAANLTATGLFRGKVAPDTFAVVASTSNPAPSLLPPKPARVAVVGTVTERVTSTTSNHSSSSHESVLSQSTEKIWGQTEVVYKSRNPHWANTVKLECSTGSQTYFYVHIFQHFGAEAPKSLGTALFHVDDLLSTKNSTRCKRLRGGGCLFCQLEPVRENSQPCKMIQLQLRASDLLVSRQAMFGQREVNTVLEIAKRGDSNGWIVVHRSAPVQNSLNPVYDEINLSLDDLCGSSLDRQLRLYVYHLKGKGTKRSLIGLSETTLWHLLRHYSERTIANVQGNGPMRDETPDDDAVPLRTIELLLQRNSKKLKEVGRIHVCKATVRSETASSPTEHGSPRSVSEIVDLTKLTPLAVPSLSGARNLTSYLEQGCQIDFCVAIDFTSSNGDPAVVDSNHYQGENTLNDYEETICAIGQALAKYSGTEYAVWGFGAKFGNVVRHYFQCGATPTVTGVTGILEAYRSMFLSDLIMSGPTDFTLVLQAAAARAKRHDDAMRTHPRYTVLLVITDGIMYNFEATRQRLDLYCSMPLSIVFVGVGRSDFALMHQLCQFPHTGSPKRCNTTFVSFRQHQQDPASLGEAALQNIPWQLCQYMQQRGM